MEIIGQRFVYLTVILVSGDRAHVRCDCGAERDVAVKDLINGHTKSCGCLRAVRAAERSTTHGATRGRRTTPEYNTWRGMVERCTNPNHVRYARYGGRGIAMCERWRLFANFLADMGPRPEGFTLDRIDTDGDYEPENCRWLPAEKQARNASYNRVLTIRGKKGCVAEWSEQGGLHQSTIQYRLNNGWEPESAVTAPLLRNKRG